MERRTFMKNFAISTAALGLGSSCLGNDIVEKIPNWNFIKNNKGQYEFFIDFKREFADFAKEYTETCKRNNNINIYYMGMGDYLYYNFLKYYGNMIKRDGNYNVFSKIPDLKFFNQNKIDQNEISAIYCKLDETKIINKAISKYIRFKILDKNNINY